MLGIRIEKDMICEILAELQGRNQPLSRSMTSQLLVGNIIIKYGSVGGGNDWVNGANITNNHHLPIHGNGRASTNRACHPGRKEHRGWI